MKLQCQVLCWKNSRRFIECKALKLEGYRNSLLSYTPLRSLEPVFFQFCEDSCTEMKTNRCSLQLVSPISSLIYPRRELCFVIAMCSIWEDEQDAGLAALCCRGNTSYQFSFFTSMNCFPSCPCSKLLPLLLSPRYPPSSPL